jgi:hypothetical protein
MGERVMGKAQIKANGRMLDSFPGATMDLGGEARESVIGANKVLGFKGSLQQSKLECEIAIKEGLSLAEIRKWTDVTVTMEADTGQTWVISNGWSTTPPSVTENDGKAKIIIEGPPAEEML